MNQLPRSYSEAKQAGSKFYFTGLPCKHGHIDKRRTVNLTCEGCNLAKAERFAKANPEKVKAAARKRYANNAETHKANVIAWRKQNPDKVRGYRHRTRAKRHAAMNAPIALLHAAEIRRIYAETPAGYHVDHEVPLNGENICGLHVPWNLRHITKLENLRKGNKLYDTLA